MQVQALNGFYMDRMQSQQQGLCLQRPLCLPDNLQPGATQQTQVMGTMQAEGTAVAMGGMQHFADFPIHSGCAPSIAIAPGASSAGQQGCSPALHGDVCGSAPVAMQQGGLSGSSSQLADFQDLGCSMGQRLLHPACGVQASGPSSLASSMTAASPLVMGAAYMGTSAAAAHATAWQNPQSVQCDSDMLDTMMAMDMAPSQGGWHGSQTNLHAAGSSMSMGHAGPMGEAAAGDIHMLQRSSYTDAQPAGASTAAVAAQPRAASYSNIPYSHSNSLPCTYNQAASHTLASPYGISADYSMHHLSSAVSSYDQYCLTTADTNTHASMTAVLQPSMPTQLPLAAPSHPWAVPRAASTGTLGYHHSSGAGDDPADGSSLHGAASLPTSFLLSMPSQHPAPHVHHLMRGPGSLPSYSRLQSCTLASDVMPQHLQSAGMGVDPSSVAPMLMLPQDGKRTPDMMLLPGDLTADAELDAIFLQPDSCQETRAMPLAALHRSSVTAATHDYGVPAPTGTAAAAAAAGAAELGQRVQSPQVSSCQSDMAAQGSQGVASSGNGSAVHAGPAGMDSPRGSAAQLQAHHLGISSPTTMQHPCSHADGVVDADVVMHVALRRAASAKLRQGESTATSSAAAAAAATAALAPSSSCPQLHELDMRCAAATAAGMMPAVASSPHLDSLVDQQVILLRQHIMQQQQQLEMLEALAQQRAAAAAAPAAAAVAMAAVPAAMPAHAAVDHAAAAAAAAEQQQQQAGPAAAMGGIALAPPPPAAVAAIRAQEPAAGGASSGLVPRGPMMKTKGSKQQQQRRGKDLLGGSGSGRESMTMPLTPRTRPNFADLCEYNLVCPGKYTYTIGNTTDVTVDVTDDGMLSYNSRKFHSISAFALVILKQRNPQRQSCDGWKEVKHNGMKMEVLRHKCLQMMIAAGKLPAK